MEIRLAGFSELTVDSINENNSKKSDEFSEIFSALLNVIPNPNTQQLNNLISVKNDDSVSFDNASYDLLIQGEQSHFANLKGLDLNIGSVISDLKTLSIKPNESDLVDNFLKLELMLKELGEKLTNDDSSELINRLNTLTEVLKENNLYENKFYMTPAVDNPLKKESDTGEAIYSKFELNLEEIKNSELDEEPLKSKLRNNDAPQAKNSFLGNINEQAANNLFDSSTLVQKSEIEKNTLEISKLITKPEDIFEVAVEKFKSLRLPDRTEVNVKLRPEELGEITVKVVLEKGQVNGSIFAENREVVNMLRNQIEFLKQEMRSNNINLTSLNVNVSSDNFFDKRRDGREFYQENRNNSSRYGYFEELAPSQEENGFTIMA